MGEKRVLTVVEYLEFTVGAGESIYFAMRDAVTYSLEKQKPVRFVFNDTPVLVNAEKIISELVDELYNQPRNDSKKAPAAPR